MAGGVRGLPAWAKANRLRAALAAGAGVVFLASAVLTWLAIASYQPPEELVTLDMVLEALDIGAYEQTRELARKLQTQGDLPIEELGGPVFALGAAAAYEADTMWSKDRTDYYKLASRYLEEAQDLGFPAGRRAEGLYLLGKSLYLGGRIPASRPILQSALKVNKRKQTEIRQLLAGAYLDDANPDLDKALAENEQYLADRRLPSAVRHEGLLQRAQILLRLGRIPECMTTLDEIPADAKNHAEAVIIRGRILMHEARELKNRQNATAEDQLQAQGKYEKAIKTLQFAQGRDTLKTQATRKAMYLIGVCYLEMGGRFHRAALEQFARTRKLYPDTPEGLMSDFQEGELYRKMVGQNAEALAAYRRMLKAITDPDNFTNPWITLDTLRSRMLIAYQYYLETQNFEVSLQLTRDFYPLFSRTRTLELTAEAHRRWGEALLSQAPQLPADKVEPTRQIGRAQLRQAGRVYSRLAKTLVATREYPDQLWNSANAYLEGQDYRNAIRVLQEYLKNEARRRHPQALVRLGEALLALNRTEEALEAFQECVEFHPDDAAAFRARLLASRAYLEAGDLRHVETLLKENLYGGLQSPDSQEWRDSLFALGELYHIERRFQDAIVRLEEAVERYPDDPQTLRAQYLIADSYRQSAEAAQKKRKQDLAGAARVVLTRQIQELFNKSLDKYREIQQLLGHRQETGELRPLEKAMLRNCYFATGEVLFALGEYEAAIKAYSTATYRYQNEPEVLTAYIQIANAYHRLNDPIKARSTLEQAKVVLGRMKTESEFTETTNYTRQEWSELLDSLSKL
ncbi:MAG: tetratricopeptide repeat protein [Pirellulales bacterium]|nr:tetratricopeptide repeat protein [Pirellulales bacterium]